MAENVDDISAVLNAAKMRLEKIVGKETRFLGDRYSESAAYVRRSVHSVSDSDQLGLSLISAQDAQRHLATRHQISEFRRAIGDLDTGDRPRVIHAEIHSDGNRSIVDDYLSDGYVAHATYRPFEKLVPQYPRRPGETWMGRPIPLAWATSRSDRAVYFGLCERPGIEGGSCTHFSPDRSDMLVTYSLPRGTQRILGSPENRGYVMMFRKEGWRKATAQQMYVTDRPMIPEAIVEITPDAWTGPPIAELPDKPVPRRPHRPFGYEFNDEQRV